MTEIASHRGGALIWPENSPTAFHGTTDLAVEQVEFDVHPTRDGRLVVIHDATVDRTTDGTGRVCEIDWAALAQLRLKGTGADRIPLLDEVIEIFRPTPIGLRIEIKPDANGRRYPGIEAEVLNALRRHHVLERTVVTSFQLATLAEVTRQAAPRDLIWLVAQPVLRDLPHIADLLGLARASGAGALGLHVRQADAEMVDACRDAGIGVGCYGCGDEAAIAHALALGVDVFTTDRPDIALDLRARRNAA
ncbi:MAG: glycerophosphodiester phosphodiesterase [Alphaproteobacteria bacterium]